MIKYNNSTTYGIHEDHKKITLVYLLSMNHSGTTLLNLMMDSHTDIRSTGRLSILNSWTKKKNLCTCGKFIYSCSFWHPVLKQLSPYVECGDNKVRVNYIPPQISKTILTMVSTIIGIKPYQFSTDEKQYIEWNYRLFSAIKQSSDKSIILDGSLDMGRLLLLYMSGLFDIKLVYLIRDGRGVVNSHRKTGYNISSIAKNWTMIQIVAHLIFYKLFKPAKRIKLLYDDIAVDPVKELKRLCAFLGLEYQDDMLEYASKEHHIIGGNKMRFKKNDKIKHDNSWKKELSLTQKLKFAVVGGLVNTLIKKV